MSPTVLLEGRFRFFFNSNEEPRCHIHVAAPDGVAKFWLEPTVALASFHGLRKKDLRDADLLVRKHESDFKKAWTAHFAK